MYNEDQFEEEEGEEEEEKINAWEMDDLSREIDAFKADGVLEENTY